MRFSTFLHPLVERPFLCKIAIYGCVKYFLPKNKYQFFLKNFVPLCAFSVGLCEILHRTSEKNKYISITAISSTALMVKTRLFQVVSFAHRLFRLRLIETSSVRKKTMIMISPILFCIACKDRQVFISSAALIKH